MVISYQDTEREFSNACSHFRWWMETDHMDKHFMIEAIMNILNHPAYRQNENYYEIALEEDIFVGDEALLRRGCREFFQRRSATRKAPRAA